MKLHRGSGADRAASWAIAINIVQIAALVVFTAYILLAGTGGPRWLTWLLAAAAVLTVTGAMLDVAEALRTLKRVRTISELKDTNDQMDELNLRLRAQRHDFINHMQVVYNLIELEEYGEAKSYLERLSNEFRSVSRVLKTKVTAFNALLQAKESACAERGIAFSTEIRTLLDALPLPAWELCTVIANLIDNAMDALEGREDGLIRLSAEESAESYTLRVANNGPEIPPEIADRLFEPDVTTKGEGHGMGLSIARKTLAEYGGGIALEESDLPVCFTVIIPRAPWEEKE